MRIIDIILLFFLYSFIGWLTEVLEGLINRKEFVNRGFLVGPICPIYGFGALFMIGLLKNNDNFIIIFLLGSLVCTFLEYVTSLILEKIFNTRWWDYRDKKINFNGRVCLEVMIIFGIGSILLMKVMRPIVSKALLLPDKVKIVMVSIFLVLFLADIIMSCIVLKDMKKDNLINDEDITKKMNTRVKKALKEKGYFKNRVLNAFPLLKTKTRH